MTRSDEGGSDGNGGRSQAGGSQQATAGTPSGGNGEVLGAILARLDKLDEIESAIQTMSARVSALEETGDGSAEATGGGVEPAPSRKPHFKPLGDPELATKRMLDVSLRGALEKYDGMTKDEATAAFLEDFEAWEQKHFQSADKRLVREVRDLLISKGIPIKRAAFLQVSQALSEFRDTADKPRVQGSDMRGIASKVSKAGLAPGRPPDGDDGDSSGGSDHDGNHTGRDNRRRRTDGTSDTRGTTYKNITAKPADVAKALPRDAVYEGKPTENIRRKYQLFLSACRIAGLDLDDENQINDVMVLTWLKGAARLYYEDRLSGIGTASEVVNRLEKHFLSVRVRRINEERWNSLTFDLVRRRQIAHSNTQTGITHESTLNLLFSEINNLEDIRLSNERSDQNILSKIISSVRNEELFRPICLQPPESVEEMKALLRGVAVEADNKALLDKKPIGFPSSLVAVAMVPDSDIDTQESEVYYVDRRYLAEPTTRKVPGYGARYTVRKRISDSARKQQPTLPSRRPPSQGASTPKGVQLKLRDGTILKPNQCIVCMEFGCHSSLHKKATKAFHAAVGTENGHERNTSDGEMDATTNELPSSEADASFLSEARLCAFLGVSTTEPKGLVGMIVDTGASWVSTIGEKWLPALRKVTNSNLELRESAEDIIPIQGLGNSRTYSKASFLCPFYFGHQAYTIRVYVVHGFSPFLLSHRDMDSIGISYHSLEKKVVRPEDGYEQDVVWHRDLPHLPFISVSYLSEVQLKNIHRSLGHAPADKVVKLLEVADESLQSAEVRAALDKIAQDCRTCSLTQPAPRRFLFSSRYEGIGSFNSTIFVDMMSLTDGKVLHVICAGTGYQGATFIVDSSAKFAWKALCQCWIHIYSGAPDEIYHDAGTNFASAEFRDCCTSLGITVHEVPTEAHHSIGAVERAHATLRTVYNRIALDEPGSTREERLQLALRCVNDAPGPGGISPTMLVYGVIPKVHMPHKRDLSLDARIRTIRECTILARRLKAQRLRDEAARRKNVPNVAHIRALEKLIPGDNVLVFREKQGWQSYPFIRLEKDSVVVQLPTKQAKFAITSCRPAGMAQVTSEGDLVPIADAVATPFLPVATDQPQPEFSGEPAAEIQPVNGEVDASDEMLQQFLLETPITAFISPTIIPEDINHARQTEMQGLLTHETFTIVPEEESHGHRLYGYRFVDKAKPDGTIRSRFCVQAFNDRAHGLLTFAPTIQRQSLRLLLAIGAGRIVETRDVRQAFVQADSTLRRPVYVKAPPELELPPGNVLSVQRPLYGMPEAPLHWFTTYTGHHKNRLDMHQLCGDPCVLYTKGGLPINQFENDEDDGPQGIVGIQVDDSIIIGNVKFRKLEEEESKNFLTKKKVMIGKQPTLFNGLTLWRDDNGDLLVRCAKQDALEQFESDVLSFEEFRSVRARCAYVAHSTSPLVLYDVARLTQVTKASFQCAHTDDVRRIIATLPLCPPLRYRATVRGKLEISICIDASFASNEDMSSQLGVICLLREKETGKCNIIHYVSVKSKRVCRSALVAELLAMIEGFDIGFSVRNAMRELNGEDIPLALYTDSQSLYHLSISLTRTRERRMQIDLQILREAYENREITDIFWISGSSNPADGLTKRSNNKALFHLVHSHTFAPEMQSSIYRDAEPVRVSMCQSIHKAESAVCGAT